MTSCSLAVYNIGTLLFVSSLSRYISSSHHIVSSSHRCVLCHNFVPSFSGCVISPLYCSCLRRIAAYRRLITSCLCPIAVYCFITLCGCSLPVYCRLITSWRLFSTPYLNWVIQRLNDDDLIGLYHFKVCVSPVVCRRWRYIVHLGGTLTHQFSPTPRIKS